MSQREWVSTGRCACGISTLQILNSLLDMSVSNNVQPQRWACFELEVHQIVSRSCCQHELSLRIMRVQWNSMQPGCYLHCSSMWGEWHTKLNDSRTFVISPQVLKSKYRKTGWNCLFQDPNMPRNIWKK